jgi:acyl-CoA-binding protein
VKKFFYLEEIEQGFYIDLDENEKGYFEIPRQFKWEEFEDITKKVREDCKYPDFDGAIGVISKHGVNQNIIRIYHPQLDKEKILDIGKSYIKHLFV